MPKKTIIILIAVLTANVLALDIYGLWELGTGDVTLNEDLHVYPGGVIQPYNAARILTVNGNIINEGVIRNYPSINYYLTVNCTGNLNNTGTMTNYITNMNGTSVQYVSTGSSSSPISSIYFNINNTNPILALTDLYFKDSVIDFISGGFDLRGGYGLNISGGLMTDGDITGKTGIVPVSYLNMTNSAYINNSSCSDLYLLGYITAEENVVFNGNCINTGDILPRVNAHRTITVNNNFINNGTIRNDAPYLLLVNSYDSFTNNGVLNHYDMSSYGDFWNNGAIYNQYLNFKGTSAQNISCTGVNEISAYYVSSTNASGIIAQSDLKFTNSYLNFGDFTLDLTAGYDIFLNGGYLNRIKIFGDTSGKAVSYLNMTNGCYMQNTELNQLTLSGEIDIVDNANVFNGPIVNEGIVQNGIWYWYTLTLNGDFINNSVVRDNTAGYNLYVDSKGNIVNNGTWDTYSLNFKGSSVQNLSCLNGSHIEAYYTSCTNPQGIKLLSDVTFKNSWINFTDYTVDLTDGYDLTVSGGYMNRTRLLGSSAKARSSFYSKNDCYIQNTVIESTDIRDTLLVVDNANILKGPLTNYGVIQNYGYWYTLNIQGDFCNESVIRDNSGGYNLTVKAAGNIENNGTWSNHYLYVNGTADQQISILNSNNITCPEIYFESELVNSPWQWFYNNSAISVSDPDFAQSTTFQLLFNVPLSSIKFGTYYCQTGDGPTRKIFVNDGVFAAPNITSFSNNGTTVSIVWENIPSASSYKVFSGPDPYSETGWTLEAEPVTNSWSGTPVGSKKFYVVKAVY